MYVVFRLHVITRVKVALSVLGTTLASHMARFLRVSSPFTRSGSWALYRLRVPEMGSAYKGAYVPRHYTTLIQLSEMTKRATDGLYSILG